MRSLVVMAAVLLAGCQDASDEVVVEADLLPGEGSPVMFEVRVRGPAVPLHEFDPEQHALLQTTGEPIPPSVVNIDPESTDRRKAFGLGYDADRGQDMTLLIEIDGETRSFDFPA
jgi:hypothetical protein